MNLKRYLPYGALVVLLVIVDQWTKVLTERNLPWQQPVDILPFFALYRTWNPGVAFSMFAWVGDKGLLIVAVLVVMFVLFLASRTTSKLALTGFAFIIGGAIGNIIDRSVYGHVIDMFLFYTPSWSFAVFNVADSFITVGAGMVLIHELFGREETKKAE